MKRTLGLAAATALAAAALLSQAEAAPIITVDPASQDVAINGTATVNIDVSGLTQGVGGFSFDLGFDPTLLSGITLVNDPGSKLGVYNASNDFSYGIGFDASGNAFAGNVDVFYVADVNATEASLAAAQGGAFTLATITFKGLSNGLSPLTLTNYVLSESDGTTSIAGVTATNGQICVGSNCGAPSVPEPSSLWLVGLALVGLGLSRRGQTLLRR